MGSCGDLGLYLSYLEQYDVLHKVCMYTCSILATQTGIVKQQMITSGKRLHNYGKSPLLMGKLTINGHFQ